MKKFSKTEAPKFVAIVGLGNLLLGDEGFGIHVVRFLEEHFIFPPEIEPVDGGCLGLKLLDIMREKEGLILIDVFLSQNNPPGTWKIFSWEELKALSPANFVSAHQMGVREALFLAELQGLQPKFFRAYAIVPQEIGLGTQLTQLLAAKVAPVGTSIVKDLQKLGFEIRRRR